MRPTPHVLTTHVLTPHVRSALRVAGLCAGLGLLGACASTDGPDARTGLAETFSLDNYRRSNDTNGTQDRRDVNRAYTQPSLPSIGNRGL